MGILNDAVRLLLVPLIVAQYATAAPERDSSGRRESGSRVIQSLNGQRQRLQGLRKAIAVDVEDVNQSLTDSHSLVGVALRPQLSADDARKALKVTRARSIKRMRNGMRPVPISPPIGAASPANSVDGESQQENERDFFRRSSWRSLRKSSRESLDDDDDDERQTHDAKLPPPVWDHFAEQGPSTRNFERQATRIRGRGIEALAGERMEM